jgi:hypothetical protein
MGFLSRDLIKKTEKKKAFTTGIIPIIAVTCRLTGDEGWKKS